jgi:hypothetical protein
MRSGAGDEPREFEPHLTVGENVPEAALRDWSAIHFDLSDVVVLVRRNGVYGVKVSIPLGGR